MITRIRVEAVVSFEDGARLDVDVELDGELRCRRAFFDRFDAKGGRAWAGITISNHRPSIIATSRPAITPNRPTRRPSR